MVVSIWWFQIFTLKMGVSPSIHKETVVWGSKPESCACFFLLPFQATWGFHMTTPAPCWFDRWANRVASLRMLVLRVRRRWLGERQVPCSWCLLVVVVVVVVWGSGKWALTPLRIGIACSVSMFALSWCRGMYNSTWRLPKRHSLRLEDVGIQPLRKYRSYLEP